MPKAHSPIDEAHDRLEVLRAIVTAERRRAEADPLSRRNFALGILDAERLPKRDEAEGEIIALFNALELLLDHFDIAHMAATFEHASQARIGNALGAARGALEKDRKAGDRWPSRLLREAKSFQSLDSLGDLIGLAGEDRLAFDLVRKVRNDLDHGVPITTVPAITGEEARVVLGEALERLKG